MPMARHPTFNSAAPPPDTAFFDRIRAGDIGAVKNALRNKAAAHWQQTSNGQGPLHVAAAANQCRIAQELLKAGANIDARDHFDRTPLLQAARSGQPDMVAFLIGQKADLQATDRGGNTALHLAAQGASADTVIMLIEQGMDPERRNADDNTAADLALMRRNRVMAELIRSEARKYTAGRAHETARDITLLKPLAPRRRF